ncbi:MAG: hypothetical protein RR060_03245, partial [Victivallaceae bacterium]
MMICKSLFYIGFFLSGVMMLQGGDELKKISALPLVQEDVKYNFQPRGGAVVDSVLASVNGNPVTLGDVLMEGHREELAIIGGLESEK